MPGERPPKGRRNKDAYQEYKAHVRGDREAVRRPLRAVTDPHFLSQVVWLWSPRYSRRESAIHHPPWAGGGEPLADAAARDILISRTRARNALYSTLPDFPGEQIAWAERFLVKSRLDVATLLDVPSYGPSFISLWADAKKQGLSDEDAADYIWRWRNDLPPRWLSDDERLARKQPAVEPNVTSRLALVAIWRQTGDLYIPWDADVQGNHWQVRLNNFPDEYMYTLLIEGSVVGDFHEWPQAWDRGELKPDLKQHTVKAQWRRTGDLYIPWDADVDGCHWQVRLNDASYEHMYTLLIDDRAAGDFEEWPQAWDRGGRTPKVTEKKVAVAVRTVPNIDAATLLSRYRNGECENVWRDLLALGADVREALYREPVWSVAQETMRRAAHNVKLVVEKLHQLDYRFLAKPEDIAYPCTNDEERLLGCWDREGLSIPFSLRAFLQEVGWVSLLGSHPALAPLDDRGRPVALTDPLQVTGGWDLEPILEEWESASPGDREPISWEISADAEGKAGMMVDEEPGGVYAVQLPNAAADASLGGAPHELTFTQYLRLSFRWGGFPGWENYEDRPDKELAFLREGLLPL